MRKRVLTLGAAVVTLVALLSLLMTVFVVSAPSTRAAERTTSSMHKGFEYHLIKQRPPVVHNLPGGTQGGTPYAIVSDCLNVYLGLTNPQLDVIEVYAQVQNYCGSQVRNLTLEWDTGVTCNGQRDLGPTASYNVGTLNYQTGWAQISDWSAICWSADGAYPVDYDIAGYADANGIFGTNSQATGQYDTPTYVFI